jgi:penicillin V acylase-like amidase (Ntn superfamily)
MWFVPAGNFGYGRVCFGWYSQAQGGMNDRGLFMDWAALPDTVPPPRGTGKSLPDGCMAERVLATCATTENALRLFESIDYVGNPAHFLVVDRNGAKRLFRNRVTRSL